MFDLLVKYDDGNEVAVRAGQREMAAWEQEKFGCSSAVAADEKPILFFRYLAYSALRRTGQLPPNPIKGGGALPFVSWSDGVDEVRPDGDEEAADPTTPDQPSEG